MQTYVLRGVEVEFPYDAYACQVSPPRMLSSLESSILLLSLKSTCCVQLEYMERVIQALQEVCLLPRTSVLKS